MECIGGGKGGGRSTGQYVVMVYVYGMQMRRTRGIEEFEFEEPLEHCGDRRKLSVVIMVSGWMIDAEDHRKTFGVVPQELSLEERLTRFYAIHCPARCSVA